MAKYKLPVMASSYVEVEASTLEDAINQVYNGDPDIPGVDKSSVSSWEIDQWSSFEKDGEVITDENGDVYISDILEPSKY